MTLTLSSITEIIPAPLLSFGLTTVAAIVTHLFRSRVKLVWGLKAHFMHVVRPKKEGDVPVKISTAHFVVQNAGRASAKEVEAVFNFEPDEVSVWPQRSCRLEINHENRLIVKFEFIAPREFVDVVILCINRDLPVMLNVKSPECLGKQVELNYHRVLPKPLFYLGWASIFLGVVFVVEKVIRFLVSY